MKKTFSIELRVSGPTEGVIKFKKQASGHIPWGQPSKNNMASPLNFHSLVPIPEDVLKAGYALSGFDWELANWGCNWGARKVKVANESEDYLCFYFETTWAPPVEFLRKVCKQWPALTFTMVYDEPASGFTGTCNGHGEHFENYRIEYCS